MEDRASTQTPQQASHKWQLERVRLGEGEGGREGERGSGGQGVDPNPAAGISQVAAGAGKTGSKGGREGGMGRGREGGREEGGFITTFDTWPGMFLSSQLLYYCINLFKTKYWYTSVQCVSQTASTSIADRHHPKTFIQSPTHKTMTLQAGYDNDHK